MTERPRFQSCCKNNKICSIIILIKITGPDELERPKAFDNVAPRVKPRVVVRLEDTLWFIKLHGGILFYPVLELAVDKLLAGNLSVSYL